MKLVYFFLIIIGTILIFVGILEMEFNKKKKCKKIEYRVIPRNLYDSLESTNMQDQFSFMFNTNDSRNSTNLVCKRCQRESTG